MEDSTFLKWQHDLSSPSIRKPTLGQISILYSVAVILLLFVGFRLQRYSLYPGLLITEFGLILMPSILLLYIYKYDVKQVLRLNRVGAINLLLTFFIMLFALPVVGVLNLLNLLVINNIFGRIIVPDIPQASNFVELLINVLVIAGSAGICEEVMFRGVIQRGLERFGAIKSILITAFLFGLLHLDFQRFFGTFLLGALIGFIVYRTNSLLSGIFAHFANNSFAVILGYVSVKVSQIMKPSGAGQAGKSVDNVFSNLSSMPKEQLVVGIVVWFFIFMFCAIVLTGLIIAFMRTTSEKTERMERNKDKTRKIGLIGLAPGLVLVAIMYVAEGMKLKGITSDFAKGIMTLMGIG